MKYIVLLLGLLSISANSCGMEKVKDAWKGLRQTFASVSEDPSAIASVAPAHSGKPPLPKLPHEVIEYKRTQKQNVNGFLLTLLAAGVFKYNANQSHPLGDAYFNLNMASCFSLGISAAFAYKYFTTPMPTKKIQHKNNNQ